MDKLTEDQIKLVEDIKRNGDTSFFRGVVVTELAHIKNELKDGKTRFNRHSRKILHNRIMLAMIAGGLILAGYLLRAGVISL